MLEAMQPSGKRLRHRDAARRRPFLASACASSVTVADGAPASQSAANEIVRLRTRDAQVALLAGQGGRVTVYDASGAPVRTTDVDGLRSSDPALFELLKTSTATHGYLDATFERNAPSSAPSTAGGAFSLDARGSAR